MREKLIYYFFILFLYLYQIAASVILFLPPLLGFVFVYFLINFRKNGFDKTSLQIAIYLSFIEIVHGIFIFSSIFAFVIFYYYLLEKIFYKFKNRDILIIIFIIFLYIFIYCFNSFLAYVLSLNKIDFSIFYIYYICLESLLAIAVFRNMV